MFIECKTCVYKKKLWDWWTKTLIFYNFENENFSSTYTCKNVIYSYDISKCTLTCLIPKYTN